MEKEEIKTKKESVAKNLAEIEEKLNKKFALGPEILANLKSKIVAAEKEGSQELNAMLETFLYNTGIITTRPKKEVAEARKLILDWAKNQTTQHL